jgi:hypothetical protein
MKRFLIKISFLLPILITCSCYTDDQYGCLECEIYDANGYYMENYGTECDVFQQDYFAEDANNYARDVYGGFAECHNY